MTYTPDEAMAKLSGIIGNQPLIMQPDLIEKIARSGLVDMTRMSQSVKLAHKTSSRCLKGKSGFSKFL